MEVERIGVYTVLGIVGHGRFGPVYKAVDPVTGDEVAVKVLDWPEDSRRRALFRDEVVRMPEVEHPNVVRVRDFIDTPELAMLVTDFVPAVSLRQVIAQTGPLDMRQALAVLHGTLQGLAAVHAVGMVHGELTPDTIIVDESGTGRLIDFGLAGPARKLTRRDLWTGSLDYLSPEQVAGDHIDQRSDIHAAGAVLFELLTAQTPSPDGADAAVASVDPLRAAPALPTDFAALCHTTLAPEPDARPPDAISLLAAVEHNALVRFGPSWLTHTGLPELVTATMSTLPWGSGLVGGDGPAGKEQDGGSPERAASSNSPRRPRSTAGRRRTPGSLLAFFTSRHGMAASAIAGVTSVAAVSVGILLLAGRVDTTAILRPVSPTSPPSTPDATVQSFDPPITLDGKGRGTAVDQLDGDLREYLAAEASSTYREWLGVHCGLDVHDSWITVDKWDPAGFAHGSYNGCSTASAVWWKDSNGWHAMPYRAPLPCDDLEAAQIPADVLPDDSAVCRERREVFTYTFATG